MSRMKTFMTYALLLVLFYFISVILENGLIANMYKTLDSKLENSTYIDGVYTQVDIEDMGSEATKVNGRINLRVTNNMDKEIPKSYIKVDLYDDRNALVETEYIEINDFKPGTSRDYSIKLKADNITSYKASFISEEQFAEETAGDENTIRILGWDVDVSGLKDLGIDLTNVFGIDLTKLSLDTIKEKGISMAKYCWDFASSIPAWAYFIASCIVVWNLPAGYLFFL